MATWRLFQGDGGMVVWLLARTPSVAMLWSCCVLTSEEFMQHSTGGQLCCVSSFSSAWKNLGAPRQLLLKHSLVIAAARGTRISSQFYTLRMLWGPQRWSRSIVFLMRISAWQCRSASATRTQLFTCALQHPSPAPPTPAHEPQGVLLRVCDGERYRRTLPAAGSFVRFYLHNNLFIYIYIYLHAYVRCFKKIQFIYTYIGHTYIYIHIG